MGIPTNLVIKSSLVTVLPLESTHSLDFLETGTHTLTHTLAYTG